MARYKMQRTSNAKWRQIPSRSWHRLTIRGSKYVSRLAAGDCHSHPLLPDSAELSPTFPESH